MITQPSNISSENKSRELKRLKRAYNAVRKVWKSAELFDENDRRDDIGLSEAMCALEDILVRNKETIKR